MERVRSPELLDSDSGTPREVADSLVDLRMFNRFFGGVHVMGSLLREVARRSGLKEMFWLDVAGGAGDLARLTRQDLFRSGIELRPVVLDRASSHMNGVEINIG